MIKKLTPFLFLFGLACTPSKEVMYRQSVDFTYHPATNIAYDFITERDSLHLYLKFADETLFKSELKSQLKLNYIISLSYEKAEVIKRDSVAGFGRRLLLLDDEAYADFKLPLAGIRFPSVLQLQIKPHPGEKDVHWLDIPLSQEIINKTILLLSDTTDQPLFRNYVTTSEQFRLKLAKPMPTVQVKQYQADFPAALPPFSLRQKQVSPTLNLVQSRPMLTDRNIRLQSPGMYVLEAGTGSVPVNVEENVFPDLTTARELIEPLIYITSSQEREKLYKAGEPKIALDQFWLDVAKQDKSLAKYLIKTFYGRVKEANIFFSSHKAGWLTDRGMVYIIFGKPDAVNRRLGSEEWSYVHRNRGGAVLKFIFMKKPNTFTQNHYELIRSPEYEFVWYSTVEKWRKGTIQEE